MSIRIEGKLKLIVGEREFKLTLEEALELKRELNIALPDKTPSPLPCMPDPVFPTTPWPAMHPWERLPFEITCGDSVSSNDITMPHGVEQGPHGAAS